MFEPRPYERDSRDAELNIAKMIDDVSGELPMEIIVSSLLSSVIMHLKQLVNEDQRQIFGLMLNEFCNDLESVSWVVHVKPEHYLEIMHRYDRRHAKFHVNDN